MNHSKLNQAVDESGISKREIAKRTKLSRVTIDGLLNGKDSKISTLEAVAQVLGINPGKFFDDTPLVVERREAGRDYVEKGKIEHHGPEYNGTDATLAQEVQHLKERLADKEEIIKLLRGEK